MSGTRAVTVLLTGFSLWAFPVGPTPAAEAPAAAALGRLSAALSRVALPGQGPICSVRVSPPQGPDLAASCDAGGGGEAASPGGEGAFTLVPRALVQTPRWYAALAPLRGGAVAAARVHGYGDVAAFASDGRTLWTRPSLSFFPDWGIKPWIVPFVLLGSSPVNPQKRASERPYAVGDLTGDLVDDVAVGHYVRFRDDAGKIRATGALTVLDGRDGVTRWSRLYPGYVTQVLVSGGTLVVGNETGDVAKRPLGTDPQGEDGTTTTLRGLRFSEQGGALEAAEAWSVQTGKQWARWLAAEPAGPGRVAAAWMDKALGAASGVPGHTMLVAADTGDVLWSRDSTGGYPRVLRHDPGRDLVVVAEQPDPLRSATPPPVVDYVYSYSLVGLRGADGGVAATLARPGAILLSLAVGDVRGGAGAEWIVGDAVTTTLPNSTSPEIFRVIDDFIVGGRVAALDPEAGGPAWTRESRCPQDIPLAATCGEIPLTYGLRVVPSRKIVVTAAFAGSGTALSGLSGGNGQVMWHLAGDPAFPLFLAPLDRPAGPAVLAATSNLIVRAYDPATGDRLLSAPLLYDVHAADAADVNADGAADLIVGGESAAVFALDGRDPGGRPLWVAEVDGPVHQVQVVDLGSDGEREVVAAASSQLAVLDADDGTPVREVERRYPDPLDYVWTFTTGDVNGDGGTDVVVPTRSLAAYDGQTGTRLFEFQATNPHVLAYFSQAVITPDRRVAAQFLTRSGIPFLNARSHQVAVAIDGRTGQLAWARGVASKFSIVDLWRSVVPDPDHPCGAGTAVGFTWEESPAALPGWHPRLDVYDSAAGTACYTAGPLPEGGVHMGTVHIPGLGVLEFNWFNVARLRPEGVTEVHFAQINAAVTDVAMADFGSIGKAFLKTWAKVQAYGPTTPTGAEGDNPPELASWSDLNVGRMHVEDLDGDGADEVVAMHFDWPGYARVASFSGVGVFGFDYLPHGVAVLEAIPAG